MRKIQTKGTQINSKVLSTMKIQTDIFIIYYLNKTNKQN